MLAPLVLTGLVAALRAWPHGWWLPVTGGSIALELLMTVVTPVLIVPLFLRSHPLPAGPLADDLNALAERGGVRVRALRVLEASEKTSSSNAFVAGHGPTRRIMLFDTLLGEDPEADGQLAETRAVLAHELGHHASGDLWRLTAASAVATAVALVVVAEALLHLPDALAHRGDGAFAMLPALLLCTGLAQVVAGVALGAYSRRRERAADAYGVALVGEGEPFARALERLCATNLAELRPPRLEHWLGASHPPPVRTHRTCTFPREGESHPRGERSDVNAVLEKIGRVYARAQSSRAEGKQGTGVARVISLANQKGGVAKTTSTVNLAVALAEKGRRVLIVDLDPQSNLTMSQGFDPEKLEQSMFDVLVQRMPIEQIIKHAEVDIAVASIELAGAELALASMIGRERALEKALLPVQGDYDDILVDTPPSLGLITVNALTASDGVIVPVQCEYLSLRGLVQLEHTLSAIRENLNPRVKIIGILPTMYDARSLHVREAVEILEENFGELVFKTRIRKTIRYAEAPVKGQSVLRYEPKGQAADAYRALAEEVIKREQT